MYKRLIAADPSKLVGLPEQIEEVLEGPCHAVSLAFNPFGTLLATGCKGGEVVVWDYETRGISRTFKRHSHAVTSLLWTRSGRTLFSACAGGKVAAWDVLSGSVFREADLGGRSITSLSMPATPGRRWQPMLLSFSKGPALLRDVFPHDGAAPRPDVELPAIGLDGDGRGARVLTGAAATASGALAAFSPSGGLIVSACQGLLTLLRCERSAPDAATGHADVTGVTILDVVKLQGLPAVTGLSFDAAGGRLLVTAQDRSVRVYEVAADVAAGAEAGRRMVSLAEVERLAAQKFPKQGSLVHSEAPGQPSLPLRLTRRFESQVEKGKWGAACFSPDSEHIVSSVASEDEHVIYTWNAFHGYPENTLQAGKDGVVALVWHPDQAPMQLLALGKSGKVHIWAKIFTQNWSAFAPDFEDLAENREHIETETEFDVNPPSESAAGGDDAGAGGVNGGAPILAEGEDSDVDVVGGGEPSGAGELWGVPEIDGEAPLFFLPITMPETTAEESEPEPEGGEEGDEAEVEGSEEGRDDGVAAMEEDVPGGSGALAMLLAAAEGVSD